ncbi:MAG: diacylglycerol kinase family protein [Ferruginibacter sp.]
MSRLLKSFGHAWRGIKYCLANEQNFKLHVIAGFAAIVLAFFLKCTVVEWMIILLCIALVICLEMVNSAIEKFCNITQKDFHPLIKMIKDTAAGAVLFASVVAAVCGTIIFLPKLLQLFY